MDGPSWWNNRFWRPVTTSGDGRLQKPPLGPTMNQSGSPLTSWFAYNRRVMRPGLRNDIYRRDSSARPLGSLRVSHGSRRGSVENVSAANGSVKSAYRPTSAAIHGKGDDKGNKAAREATSLEEVRQSTSRATSALSGNKMWSSTNDLELMSQTKDIMQGSLNYNEEREEYDNAMESQDKKPFMTFQQFQQHQYQQKTIAAANAANQQNPQKPPPPATSSSEQLQAQASNLSRTNSVVTTRFGRRIVRPNSGGIITKVGDLKLVDLEETLNIQSQPLYIPPQNKFNGALDSNSGSPYHSGTFQNSFSGNRPLSGSIAQKSDTRQTESESSTTGDVPYRSIFFNGNPSITSTEVISQPPKVPLKSILKRSELLQKQSSMSNTSPVNQTPNVSSSEKLDASKCVSEAIPNDSTKSEVQEDIPQVETANNSFKSADNFALTKKSSQNIQQPLNNPASLFHGRSSDESLRNRMLMRRSMRSAPALKRGVRFDMRNTDVFEFHPADSIRDLRYYK